MGWLEHVKDSVGKFTNWDSARKNNTTGMSNEAAGLEDRRREGALMAALMGPVAPAATLPVALAGAGYEGVKALAQKTGTGKYLPGPFKTSEATSPASVDNVLALLKGFQE